MHIIYCLFQIFVLFSITQNPMRKAKWSFKGLNHAEITLHLLLQTRYIDKNPKIVYWKQKATKIEFVATQHSHKSKLSKNIIIYVMLFLPQNCFCVSCRRLDIFSPAEHIKKCFKFVTRFHTYPHFGLFCLFRMQH